MKSFLISMRRVTLLIVLSIAAGISLSPHVLWAQEKSSQVLDYLKQKGISEKDARALVNGLIAGQRKMAICDVTFSDGWFSGPRYKILMGNVEIKRGYKQADLPDMFKVLERLFSTVQCSTRARLPTCEIQTDAKNRSYLLKEGQVFSPAYASGSPEANALSDLIERFYEQRICQPSRLQQAFDWLENNPVLLEMLIQELGGYEAFGDDFVLKEEGTSN